MLAFDANFVSTALSAVGFLTLGRLLWSVLRVVCQNHFLSGLNLKKFSSDGDSFAVVTGATNGIGKEFALQLAKLKFNILLVSRSPEKLDQTAAEIVEKFPDIKVKTFIMDFSQATESDYQALKKVLDTMKVDVLGTNHSIPTPFVEESVGTLEAIVKVNVWSVLRLTHLVLPQMMDRHRGLVLNVGSFAGALPTPFLQTYAGSKAMLRNWSESLAAEVKPNSVHVELLNTYFVVSNMSKIRRATWMIPSATTYVRNALKRVGRNTYSTPYPWHNWLSWAVDNIISRDMLVKKSYELQVSIRKRALKKMKESKEE